MRMSALGKGRGGREGERKENCRLESCISGCREDVTVSPDSLR